MPELSVGAAKVDITPLTSCWMEGYSTRKDNGPKSSGVHDRLHARALVAEGGGASVALVSCDLCNVSPETVEEIRTVVCPEFGMPPEHLMLVTTHTHAGPVTTHPIQSGASKTDREWLEACAHKIIEAILLAHRRRASARLGVLRGESRIAMNRQETHPDGSVDLGHAPEKPIDPEVIALTFDSLDGRPIARLINYGCHATSLGPKNSRISGDYAGRAMTALEEKIGGGAVCPFVNGGAGNVNPFHRALEDPADPRAGEVADRFANDVLGVLARESAALPGSKVAGVFQDIALPRKLSGVEAGLGRFKRVRLQALRIGDVALVGSPHEIVCEIVMNVKKRSPVENTLVAGYCYNAVGPWHRQRDGSGGYLPAASHYDHGGYEVRQTPYSPDAEAVFTQAMVDMAGKIMQAVL